MFREGVQMGTSAATRCVPMENAGIFPQKYAYQRFPLTLTLCFYEENRVHQDSSDTAGDSP
jgi:hypothetical protein